MAAVMIVARQTLAPAPAPSSSTLKVLDLLSQRHSLTLSLSLSLYSTFLPPVFVVTLEHHVAAFLVKLYATAI